jgi:membrane protein YdbS with pleckstrin-like domain
MEDLTDERAMKALHPDQIWVLRIRAAVSALMPIGAFAVLDFSLSPDLGIPPGLITGSVVLLAVLALILLPRRRWRAWGYREEEDELHVRHGLLVRYRTVVPFGRVQHIDVAQGPVERRFGLATLILHTAGTRASSIPLPGLPHPEAEQMRDRIRAKIRQELT